MSQCVVVDEAHERSIDIDLLLGFLKDICTQRKEFRVIISSATIEPSLFITYFEIQSTDAIVRIPGRTFPVHHEYMTKPKDLEQKVALHAANKVVEVLTSDAEFRIPGDILVFLPTPDDISEAIKRTQELCTATSIDVASLLLCPLHGRLEPDEQQQIFDRTPSGKTKVVFATNVAETSVTVDGITAVIDTGLAKTTEFDPVRNMNALVMGFINRSSATQRAGRVGRTRPGIAYHMYEPSDMERMPESVQPEILRTELLAAVLKLKDLGISHPADFDFLQHPGRERVMEAEASLRKRGFLDFDFKLTGDGRKCIKLGIDCKLARMILSAGAPQYDCVNYALIAAGMHCYFFPCTFF